VPSSVPDLSTLDPLGRAPVLTVYIMTGISYHYTHTHCSKCIVGIGLCVCLLGGHAGPLLEVLVLRSLLEGL
jgi:hypothetical protein